MRLVHEPYIHGWSNSAMVSALMEWPEGGSHEPSCVTLYLGIFPPSLLNVACVATPMGITPASLIYGIVSNGIGICQP